jgi:peptidoglycan/LPS O-acetylase OafA/YrhL
MVPAWFRNSAPLNFCRDSNDTNRRDFGGARVVYRREIDGLRALAVLPVVFFHGGLHSFQGGYVGVDVFFVISGYLITTIIRQDLSQGEFSVARFYERRARRILPALFLVMFASLAFGSRALMPDDLKNFGQSLVATTLFSNNILLAITSGYWDLASEFKPLLHTWSLGVEEQYYVAIPILLLLLWRTKFSSKNTWLTLAILLIASISSMVVLSKIAPRWEFYSLPTRAWEILLGALVALYLQHAKQNRPLGRFANAAGLLGLSFIILAIFSFSESTPSLFMTLPTMGAVLIILSVGSSGIAYSILASRVMVFIGLMSYSIYLWHQPVFAFTRALSMREPEWYVFALLVPVILLLSYGSWRLVEKPFRDRGRIKTRKMLGLALTFGLLFIASGIYLNSTYGLLSRVYGPGVTVAEMDKRIYNERVFDYKQSEFAPDPRKKILVAGDSFARDFVNITLESFDTAPVQIIYRDDLTHCIEPFVSTLSETLFTAADVIVFANMQDRASNVSKCMKSDLSFAGSNAKQVFYIGPKDFGYNLNWLIWLDRSARGNQYNSIADTYIAMDRQMAETIPPPNFISLLAPVVRQGPQVPITDAAGRLLSTDRKHLTKFGAIYFGKQVLRKSTYAENFTEAP